MNNADELMKDRVQYEILYQASHGFESENGWLHILTSTFFLMLWNKIIYIGALRERSGCPELE